MSSLASPTRALSPPGQDGYRLEDVVAAEKEAPQSGSQALF